ncbi:MAG: endolytic transglycosylase MltG [Bacillaceae bacterium]|nr:endolytic transglycosylase MltG [Bacillaceae bacterium]
MSVMTVVILGIAGLGGLAAYIFSNLEPVEASGDVEPVIVTIPSGATSLKIAQILEDNGLIKNATIFNYYIKYTEKGSQLKAGDYQFTPGVSKEEILEKLVKGDTYMETFTFTIPEGFTVEQIADRLAAQELVDRETFLKEVNEGQFDYDFVKQIPDNPDIKYRLEGYLFPETYEMEVGATEHDIINRMLKQFDTEFKAEWQQVMEQKRLTIHDAVTLASIVEREVRSDKERAKVAGVYYNRMAIDMLLQADATIQYILGEQKEIVTYEDLEIKDPYNTYIQKGLPPGPIGSPGRKSLEAVVYPEEHPYFYYVTKKDGSGEHYFAETFPEHQRNIAKSKQNQRELGTE